MKSLFRSSILLLLAISFLNLQWLQAQSTHLAIARSYVANKQYDSAIVYFNLAYADAPFDTKIYNEFLALLWQEKQYDAAADLIERMGQIRREDPSITLDKATNLIFQNKKKQADKIIAQLIDQVPQSEYELRKLANTLQSREMYDEAILVYEKGKEIAGNPYAFRQDVASLYLLKEDWEKALIAYSEFIEFQMDKEVEIKTLMMRKMEQSPEVRTEIEKTLKKLISKSNPYSGQSFFTAILQWLGQLQGDYSTTIESLIAADKKGKNDVAAELLFVAQDAADDQQYNAANTGLDYLISKGRNSEFYETAYYNLLRNYYYQLYKTRPIDEKLAQKTAKFMQQYFQEFPDKKFTITYIWYADVIGKYLYEPDSAVSLLKTLDESREVPKEIQGQAKLTMGDFYLIGGKVWEANLQYAQVDKMFRQDMMGEEARFKQAKLAFYRGDFQWAQDYLNVLKASTTELIANDAMDLSILITENTTTDTATIPLTLYAKADLMIFQHQYDSAMKILDEILTQFPQHELADDVYSLRGQLEFEKGNFAAAIKSYETIINTYHDGVIADNALLQIAQIYETHIRDYDKAKNYYEKLILDFPNSTLTSLARQRYEALNKNVTKP